MPSDCQALPLGAQRTIELPTDAPIETIGIMLTFTPTAVMETDTCGGIRNILQNVTLETYGPEGVTPVVNISGAGLVELWNTEINPGSPGGSPYLGFYPGSASLRSTKASTE